MKYHLCDVKYRSANLIIKEKSFEVYHSSLGLIFCISRTCHFALKLMNNTRNKTKKGSRNLALLIVNFYWELDANENLCNENTEYLRDFTQQSRNKSLIREFALIQNKDQKFITWHVFVTIGNWIQKRSPCIHRYGNVRPYYVLCISTSCYVRPLDSWVTDMNELGLHLINNEKNHNCPKALMKMKLFLCVLLKDNTELPDYFITWFKWGIFLIFYLMKFCKNVLFCWVQAIFKKIKIPNSSSRYMLTLL